jgi:hypothetical protein
MGAGMSQELVGIIALIGIIYFAGQGIAHEGKVLGHKVKCGVERVVGKHCDDPAQPPTS